MKKWSPGTIDKVRQAHDIVDWISRDTPLKEGSSGQHMGLCPFSDHNEKTPSFSVSGVKQVYHCFGCGRGGDLFTYFQDQKSMNFYETVCYLAEQAGIPLTYTKTDDDSSRKLHHCFKINLKASQIFHKQLLDSPKDSEVYQYLRKRKYSKEMIEKFKIGYAPRNSIFISNLSDEEKKLAQEVGLLIHGKKGIYETFRGRLMFPIISPTDRVLGFGGRSINSSLPKYINSKDSLSFQKGNIFYGLNNSARAIRQVGYALVVEGYTDLISLYQNGFQNVVATLGTALTFQHARLLKRYTNKVVLFFDGDVAGESAALRSLPLLLSEGLRVHHTSLKGMDPDECLQKKGVQFLKELLSQNQDLFLKIFSDKITHAEHAEKLEILKEMMRIVASMKDEVLKEYYKRKMVDVFVPSEQKVAEMVIQKYEIEFLKNKRSSISSQNSSPQIQKKEDSMPDLEKISLKEAPKSELYILVLALHHDSYLIHIASRLSLDQLSHLGLKKIFSIILDKYKKDRTSFNGFLSQVMMQAEPEVWLQIQSHPVLENLDKDQEKGIEFLEDCFNKISSNYYNSQVKNLVMQMKLNPRDQKKYLKKIQKIKRDILSMENSHEK